MKLRTWLLFLGLGIPLLAFSTPLAGAAAPGAVLADPTGQHIGLRWQIQGDDNLNAAVSVRFRRQGEPAWRDGLPFVRTHPNLNGEGNGRPDNRFAGSIFWLQPDTTYQVELTLTDPDGGGETRVITATTRAYGGRVSRPLPTGRELYAVPGSGGGDGSLANPFQGLQAAADAAQPGDLIHVAAGTYAPFTLLTSGTESAPIAFGGPNDPTQNPPADGSAVVDGAGTDRGVVTLGRYDQSIAHVILQGLVIQNGGWGIDAQNTSHIVVRRNVIRDVDFGYTNRRQNGLDGFQTLCDNVIEGRVTPWYQPGVIPPEQGIDLQGNGNIVCHNRVSRFGDGVSVQPNEAGNQGYSADIFGNDIFDIVDDPIEIDYATANFRVWRNRVTNARMGISLAPIFGGPIYVFRNAFFNLDYSAYKLNREPAGLVVAHNTSVKPGNGTSSDPGWQNTFFRNNVILGTRYAIEEYGLVANSLLDDWDYDALGTTDANRFVKWDDVRYHTQVELCAGAGIECAGLELPKADPFAVLMNATLPATAGARVEPDSHDLRPTESAPLINAGAVLSNLSDPFVTDGQPDIGAFEAGQPPPRYGPRPPCALPGDLDVDGDVDAGDIEAVAAVWQQPAVWPFDRDGDGLVSVLDVMKVSVRWGDVCRRDVWVWDRSVATDPAERAWFFAFAADRAIRTAYLESEWLVNHDQTALADFITAADGQGISVELLFGDAPWALTPNHGDAIALAQAGVAFAQSLSGPQPAGLHFDVEPHTLPEWSADQNGTANQYLDLLEALAGVTQGTGLRLVVDVPFWYDDRQITRAGQTRPLSEWVIDRVDRVVLMDYRDHADPPDGIIDHAAGELAYAASAGKQVVIGVETNCGLSPEKITFCEEGAAALEAALNQTRDTYRGSLAFAGFAVHDYDGYRLLGP
ncbi:MAG: hypothetical protein ACE5F6_14345 [Anaerolineae bacterium]